jgi:hypothetical protein
LLLRAGRALPTPVTPRRNRATVLDGCPGAERRQ